ncbi:Importin-11 [Gracilariopsis chorda]|uniref:Importin-11 n=1 Tax=Gracilariopsis chorda TaxID=448386 RepID=A0A2V3J101_9FLOR|nr:Importin-11 [Gracilariopsis chorda]|eukprot:PXF48048.1 Importin-11 [Gracilariopsis chorda]
MTAQQSAERIYYILKDALTQQAEVRKRAEKALRDAEEKEDYFASLAAIATAPNDQAESQSTISTQISVWISYIARSDFPNDWPNILSDLVQASKKEDGSVVLHALVTLDMVLKQLASRRLIPHRRALYRVAPMVFSELHNQFCNSLNILLQNAAPEEQLKMHFDVLVRCMKSFRRLINYGCENPADIAQLPSVMSKIVEYPDVFMRGATIGTEFQIRLSHLASKLVRVMHEGHPVQFQAYLPTFLKLYYDTIISYTPGVSHDRTCYQAALFLKNVAQCPSYRINSTTIAQFKAAPNLNPKPQGQASADTCRDIVLLFFDDDRTDLLIEAMITKIFVLTKREVETWAADPESLILDEDAAEWGAQSLRHECEELFKMLLIRDKPRIVPKILKLAEAVSKDKPLMLDACYRAVGRAVYDIQGAFDFEVWLNGHLGAILQSDYSDNLGERIIQARTAWLVAQFAEQLTRDSRRVINPLLVRLVTFMERDLVVALTAAKAIQTLAEDLGFHAGDFAAHLHVCLENCFRLMTKCDAFETKRDILGTVTCLVERCLPQHVAGEVELIATALPQMWENTGVISEHTNERLMEKRDLEGGLDVSGLHEKSSGGEVLLRTSIVGLLTALMRKVGAVCVQVERMNRMVIAVLQFSLDMSKEGGGLYLVEEGCELWSALIAASTKYTKEVRMLFPMTERILGVDFDNLREVFRVMESYALLGGDEFMNEFGDALKSILMRALGAVKDRGCLAAADILNSMLIRFPGQGVRYMAEILRDMLAKVFAKRESQVVSCAFVGLLARAVLTNIEEFETLVLERDESKCVDLMDCLVENLDAMYGLAIRKRTVACLCMVMRRYWASEAIRMRFGAVASVIVQVVRQEENAGKRDGAGGEGGKEFCAAGCQVRGGG